MGFKDNVLFYLNEAKKDKDFEEKRKVCAGDEADGSSVKTHKGAYTGSEACMASTKTKKNGCTGCEASKDTEAIDKVADKEAKKVTYGAVAKRNRMFQDNQDYLDRYVDSLAKKNKKTLSTASTEKCPNCGKAKCECSCDSEASTIAAYDQRKFKVQKETNELKKDSKMRGYEIGKMYGVGAGRKPSMEKYNDYGSARAQKDPNTNEIAKDKKMKGYSLKEEFSMYSGRLLKEDVDASERAELITESIKNKSASKKLLKIAKKMELEAAKIDDKELHDIMIKNSKMFRQAYMEISAAEDAYRAGDATAKQKYKKLTKKYAEQFRTVNKGKMAKLVAGGMGVAAVITLVAGSVLVGIQGIFDPGEQLEGIAKLTVNSPLDGIKHFFGFGKKVVNNDVTAVKNYFGTKDFSAVKDALNKTAESDRFEKDTLQNGINARSKLDFATAGKGEAKNSIKDFMSKMGKKGNTDEGDSILKNI